MSIDLFQVFSSSSVLVVFTIVGVGYLVGNIKIAGFEIGSTGGVLLCGLLFGHYGFEIDPIVQSIGFTLFIYSVGWQAGPQILNVLRMDGPRYATLSIVVAAGSLILVVALAIAADLDNGLAAGLMAGALTSTPTLVGAQNAVYAGLAEPLAGFSQNALVERIGVGYAITYIFGTIGLLLMVKFLPRLLGIDLAAEAKKFAFERGFAEGGDKYTIQRPILRAYLVETEVGDDRTLGQGVAAYKAGRTTLASIYRIKRGTEILEPSADMMLQKGDKIAFFGTPKDHEAAREHFELSEEVLDEELLSAVVDVAEIVVTNNSAIGKTIAEIGFYEKYGCYVSRLTRSQIEMPLLPTTRLQRGDVISLSGESNALEKLVPLIGVEERKVVETDLLTFAGGIVAGLFIGQITIRFGGIDVGIGDAGGLLFSGIMVGFLRANRPTFGRMPAAARFILMEFGLLLFMVGVGINAGSEMLDALTSVGVVMFLCGVAVTVTPLVFGYLFGRLILKMNPAVLLGALTGAMTSTPALAIVQSAAKSTVPSLGYAGTYALANVLLTMAGTIIMIL